MESRFCVHCGAAFTSEQSACPNCGIRHNLTQQGTFTSLPHVPDYLLWSIFTICCCSKILGIIALVFSIQCRSDRSAGRYDSAVQNSHTAFWCNVVGLGLFTLAMVLWAIILAVIVFGTLLG